MSREAQDWAMRFRKADFPRSAEAMRWTLLILASYAGGDRKDQAWPSVKTLAEECEVSERTIQRHLRDLEAAGFLARGDQRYTARYPANARPTVWRIALELSPGVTVGDTPSASVGGDTDVTPQPVGGDTEGRLGVTPGCHPNQELTPRDYSPTQVSTESRPDSSTGYEGATFTDSERDESAGDCIHGFSAGVHAKSDGRVEPWCPICRKAGFITPAPQETANA